MFKLKFLSIIFILFFFNYSKAEIVRTIVVDGNLRVNTETIELFSGILVGDNVDEQILNQSLKDLYKTGFFENVQLSLENSILTIEVLENPIIQNLLFSGVENKRLKEILQNSVSTKDKSPFIENTLENDLALIKNILQQNGYYFSKVSLLKKKNLNNSIDLIFEIDLGKKAYINEIVFLGNKYFKKNKLLNVITSEENKFWKFISSKKLLNKDRIELDKRLLVNFYKNQGFYNVKILDQFIQYDENENFKLIFNIDSGNKFYFDKINLILPDDYDANYFENLNNKLKSISGQKYSFKVIENILRELENIASSRRYEFVNASMNENIVNDNKINIEINVIDDQYKFYVQKINVLGNNITIEDVVRNEFIIDEGDPLNQILFNKSISNIKSLNIFKNVSTKIQNGNDENRKIINIEVEEKPTGEISLGAGIGTNGASTMFAIRENNFLGQGIKLDTNFSLSEETIRGLFSYNKSNFKNTDRDLILSLESQETDRLNDFGYKTKKSGFSVGTRFEHLEDFYIKPSLNTNIESIETSSSASSLLRKQEGNYFDVELNYNLDLDKRDQRFQPSDGFRSIFSQKLPININENQTIINSYEFTTYHEYLENLVASLSFYTKTANSLAEKDVRISERLYIPSRKLRGFEAGKVGPIDNGDFVGGNYITALNISTNIPLLESIESMSFNLFYDAANIWGVDYNSSINDSSALRSSAGIGVDWYTPIGPLNFSLSQAITKKSTDKTESFRFNLGTTF